MMRKVRVAIFDNRVGGSDIVMRQRFRDEYVWRYISSGKTLSRPERVIEVEYNKKLKW